MDFLLNYKSLKIKAMENEVKISIEKSIVEQVQV